MLFSFLRNREKAKNPILQLQDDPSVRPLKTLVHVGAHLAQERELYERMGFQDVLWIEGAPETYQRLQQSFSDSPDSSTVRHRLLCALLSETSGEDVSFYRFSNAGASDSMFQATPQFQQKWPQLQQQAVPQKLQTSTLDDVVRSQGLAGKVDVLVVDVQGAELLVLKGGLQTLSNVQAVVCEVSTRPFYDGGVLYPELKDFLNAHGFRPSVAPRKTHCDLLFRRAA
ncbi:MAG: FkbM family methyltransferase [Planctomycetaceae bacterium]